MFEDEEDFTRGRKTNLIIISLEIKLYVFYGLSFNNSLILKMIEKYEDFVSNKLYFKMLEVIIY